MYKIIVHNHAVFKINCTACDNIIIDYYGNFLMKYILYGCMEI